MLSPVVPTQPGSEAAHTYQYLHLSMAIKRHKLVEMLDAQQSKVAAKAETLRMALIGLMGHQGPDRAS